MRYAKLLAVAMCVLLLAGCDDLGLAVSLHPIAKEEQPQFEPALLGRWQVQDGDDVLQFEKTARGEFQMLLFKQSSLEADPQAAPEERYTAQAIRLGRFVFLDLSEAPGTDDLLKLRVHMFVRLDLSGDQFELAVMNDRWLKGALQQKRLEVSHELIGGQVVLTAAPPELRKFLERNGWDDEAFPPDSRYRRM